jgi:hypothetical protein
MPSQAPGGSGGIRWYPQEPGAFRRYHIWVSRTLRVMATGLARNLTCKTALMRWCQSAEYTDETDTTARNRGDAGGGAQE